MQRSFREKPSLASLDLDNREYDVEIRFPHFLGAGKSPRKGAFERCPNFGFPLGEAMI